MLQPEIKRPSWLPTILYGAGFLLLAALVGSGLLADADRSLAHISEPVSWKPSLLPFGAFPAGIIIIFLSILIWKELSPRYAWRFLLALALTSSLELLFKVLLDQPAGVKEHGALFLQLENAFPSGHILRATLIAGGLYLLTGWKSWWALPLLPALTMLGLDYHWASDLLGGFLLAMFSLYLLRLLPRGPFSKDTETER